MNGTSDTRPLVNESAPHDISLAVWDLTSPVVAGRRATLKVGLACSSGCNLAGTRVEVFDQTGSKVSGGALGPFPWPNTAALYWTELEVAAPPGEGNHEWRITAAASSDVVSGFSRTAPPYVVSGFSRTTPPYVVSGFSRTTPSEVSRTAEMHEPAASTLHFVAVAPPEHRVTLEVVEEASGAPIAGVELRLGRFKATTNEAGVASVDVPRGTYEIAAWKIGYVLLSHGAQVADDTTLRLTLAVEPQPEQPYWM